MKIAVIGIGSNSVRSLVSQVTDGRQQRLFRDREGTRLFAGLDAAGNLSQESMRKTIASVARMAADARVMGAEQLHVFATSAARDAANGAVFMRAVEQAAGTPLAILSGEQEAELSFFGASAVAPEGIRCGVVDIGGGSTEIVTGADDGPDCAFSCQMGAVRLFRQLPLECRQDMVPVEAAAKAILEENLRKLPGFDPPAFWAGTGGTFTTLAALAKGIPWQRRQEMHGARVSRADIRSIGEMLADLPLEKRKQLPGLQPGRADIVVHGICILLAVMERLRISEITVSEYGNLDGFIRKTYHC